MKKYLMAGVSLFAMFAVNNAMAAGYTCEELIEYTSCMPGYYLTAGGLCPDGYRYFQNVCDDMESFYANRADGDCEGYVSDEYIWFDEVCVKFDGFVPSEDDDCENSCPNSYDWVEPAVATTTCSECPTGASCAGGTADKKLCAAGTYQPSTKQTSCIDAPVGYYVSATGATEYTQCPIMDVKDKNGNTVNATTAGAGASSMSQCIVPAGVEFKDDKGIYHFKSACSFDFYVASTDGSCPSGYAYITQDSLLTEGTYFGMCDDPLGREGCYRLPEDVQDTESCEYVFNDDDCTGTVYCDGWSTNISAQFPILSD